MISSNGKGPHVPAVPLGEIQFAHDMLKVVLSGDMPEEVEIGIDEQAQTEMVASLHVLCWVLGHNNQSFRDNMRILEKALEENGVTIEYTDY